MKPRHKCQWPECEDNAQTEVKFKHMENGKLYLCVKHFDERKRMNYWERPRSEEMKSSQ